MIKNFNFYRFINAINIFFECLNFYHINLITKIILPIKIAFFNTIKINYYKPAYTCTSKRYCNIRAKTTCTSNSYT